MSNNGKRFEWVEKQGLGLGTEARILVDYETRVQYLYLGSGYGGGLTVLLGPDGKPQLYRENPAEL